MKAKNPAADGRGEAQNIKHRGRADNLDLSRNASENPAARKLAQRFRMPASTARLIADLAGLGPRDNREQLFPFTAYSQPVNGSPTYGA